MAVRPDKEMMMSPYLYRTSERVDGFFANCVKYSLSDFVLRMECWVLSGADGVSRNYRETLAELKTSTRDLIKEKLDEVAGVKTSRMNYQSFEQDITLKYGVILKHWPLQKFACPSSISSLTHIRILFNSFLTGATIFHKLSDADYSEWSRAYLARESRRDAVSVNAVSASLSESDSPTATIASSLELTTNIATAATTPTSTAPTPTHPLTIQTAPTGSPSTQTAPTSDATNQPPTQPVGCSERINAVDIRPPLEPSTSFNLVSVTDANGNMVFVPAAKRKRRSDYGKKKK